MIDDEVVDQICWSLENEPHKWQFDVNTFKKKCTNTEYWSSMTGGRITEVWDGRSCSKVFTSSQGEKIYESYRIALGLVATEKQKGVIADWSKPKEPPPTVETIHAPEGLFSRILSWFK